MRADVFGILRKVSRGGEVVGRNGPRSRATVLHICNSQHELCVYKDPVYTHNPDPVYTH